MADCAVDPAVLSRAFRKRGLSLKADALEKLAQYLGGGLERLDGLVTAIRERGLTSPMVDGQTVSDAIESLAKASARSASLRTGSEAAGLDEEPASVPVVRVVDAFSMPCLRYNPVKQALVVVDSVDGAVATYYGEAESKSQMFRERYLLAHQRAARHLLLKADGALSITLIRSLLGSPGMKLVCGMLTQISEGRFSLEDLNGHVPVDLSRVSRSRGLFTEGCVVLAQGQLEDGVFVVSELAHPPVEPRSVTLSHFPVARCCALPDVSAREFARLRELEPGAASEMVVVLSDVHLDDGRVMSRLHTLLAGLEGSRPVAFVLCGNFTSRPLGNTPGDSERLRGLFRDLGAVIGSYPQLAQHSEFVLVPGPQESFVDGALPRHGLLPLFTDPLRRRVAHLTVASNPCRLLFCSREIVIFREDLMHKLRRSAALAPSDDADAEADADEELMLTLLGQGHLSPLPLLVRPVRWRYDHALSLYPLPNALVVADSVDQFDWQHHGCDVFNPGSFATDYSFVVYRPCAPLPDDAADDGGPLPSRVEFSRIE